MNNQLGAVLAFAELIALEVQDKPDLVRMLEDIAQAVEQSTDLLDTVAALVSRDDSAVERVDLSELIPHVVALFRHEWKRMRLDYDLATPTEPADLYGVRVRLVRALVRMLRFATLCVESSPRARLDIALSSMNEAYIFRIRSTGGGSLADSASPEFSDILTGARESAAYHGGSVEFEEDGSLAAKLPRATGLESQTG